MTTQTSAQGQDTQPISRRHRIEALGARLLFSLFRALPLDMASALGGGLARLIGPRLKVSRVALANMARALPELDDTARRKAVRAMWENLGRTVAELPHLDRFNIDRPDGRVELVGREIYETARDDGVGGIFFSAHYGNWELLTSTAIQAGIDDIVQVYRAANNPLVDRLILDCRRRAGIKHAAPKGADGAFRMLRALRRGNHVAMLADQKLNNGVEAPLFGIPAMTAPAPVLLALRFGIPLIPVRSERLRGAHFRVTVGKPIHLENTGDQDADVQRGLAIIHGCFEDWIRDRPDHWFWIHKRWPNPRAGRRQGGLRGRRAPTSSAAPALAGQSRFHTSRHPNEGGGRWRAPSSPHGR